MYDLIHATSSSHSKKAIYQSILESAIEAVPAATKGCVLLLEQKSILKYAAVVGYDKEKLEKTHLFLEQSFLYRETKGSIESSVIINDPFEYDRMISADNIQDIINASDTNIYTTISVPLIFEGTLYGMINIDSPMRNAYTQEDISVLDLFTFEIYKVIQLYESIEKNKYLMNYDVLTEIYNRRFFNDYIEDPNNAPSKNNAYHIISMDVDALKTTNDQYGHHVGDLLIQQFVKGINKCLCKDTIFARIGGDEFEVIATCDDREGLIKMIEMSNAWFLKNPIQVFDELIYVQFSYGIATFAVDGSDVDQLIVLADQRMYEHKNSKKYVLK
jgi:diguanylate cyclase (GGDEF)-like protein